MAACLGVGVDLIRPAGFDISDRALRRSLMDYAAGLDLRDHDSWDAFIGALRGSTGARLVLITTTGAKRYTDFAFAPDDVVLFGRESAGVPAEVHGAADVRLKIPMQPGMRSLNVAVAAAMVTGEALRQFNGLADHE